MILKNKGLPVISRFNNNKTKDNHKGFTIVEVMIVLAIAGLILAVVFIAVPALQRNQRNSARNNDRAYIRTAYNQAVSNNGGRRPTVDQMNLRADELNWVGTAGVTSDGATALCSSENPTHSTSALCTAAGHTWIQTNNEMDFAALTPVVAPGVGIEENTIVYITAATTPANSGYNLNSPNAILMMTGVRCTNTPATAAGTNAGFINTQADGTNFTTTNANRNSLAIWYQNEGGDGTFCQDDTN